MELDNDLYIRIVQLSEVGDQCIERDQYEMAIEKYQTALNLIPNPKYDWEASTWLYTALGDAYFLDSQFEDAINYFLEAFKCVGGLENAFILLRIGQCFFELDNSNEAEEYLLRAYMYDGEDIFEEEEEKYIHFIQNLI